MTLEELADHFEGVRRAGSRILARCPAHEDRSPSLNLSEGENGTLLVICRAGCATESVLQAVGLCFSDMFPESRDRLSTRPESPFPNDVCAQRIAEDLSTQARRYGMNAADLLQARMARYGSFLPSTLDLTRARVTARLRGTPWTASRLTEAALANGWGYDRAQREAECLPWELAERVTGEVFAERVMSIILGIDASTGSQDSAVARQDDQHGPSGAECGQ